MNLRSSSSGRNDNIKMDIINVKWEAVNCIHLAQDRDKREDLANTEINLLVS